MHLARFERMDSDKKNFVSVLAIYKTHFSALSLETHSMHRNGKSSHAVGETAGCTGKYGSGEHSRNTPKF